MKPIFMTHYAFILRPHCCIFLHILARMQEYKADPLCLFLENFIVYLTNAEHDLPGPVQ